MPAHDNDIRIFLIRHGQKAKKDLSIPSYPGAGLTKLGEKQALLTAKALQTYIAKREYTLDAIYASGMLRAVQTATIMNRVFKKPISFHKDLREQNKCIFQTPSRTKFYKERIQRMKRLEKCFTSILKKKQKTIIIVGHGNAISRIIGFLQKQKPHEQGMFAHVHTGITLLKLKADKKRFASGLEVVFANHTFLKGKYVTWYNEDELL